MFKVKNWEKFQHYKPKFASEGESIKPAWIKFYSSILDDFIFHSLPVEARALLPLLWLLASENQGNVPEPSIISFRLRISERELDIALKALINKGFIESLDLFYTNSIREEKRERIEEKRGEENISCEKPQKSDFEEIWKSYPDNKPKGNKVKAKEKYLKLLKQGEDHGTIIAGVRTYHKFCSETDQYNQHLVTWLNQRGWEGEWQSGKRHQPKASYVDKIQAAGQIALRNLERKMDADRDAPWNNEPDQPQGRTGNQSGGKLQITDGADDKIS